ncbi:hypothetical protein [Maridesulfovibrio salexigens]|uniref:Putative lipoprotein n=1 Tax=Maridesulfovibrio salexigens (strain ATCC 14822 / DSM 2638 / NCIMB 8403 / VKM B-1763) TaxID=526222 RepID=C6BXF8_MARSD|nr:hypothetical protein [Maridesulfovibrio salexigens]ACS80464.1 putative lipoprotein [Maridesulfovibrio salexigens DSM 2638]
MNFSDKIKPFVLTACVAVLLFSALPAHAVKVQIFKPVDPEKEVSQRTMRQEAVTEAFAQALFAEASRMLPGTLSAERTEAVKKAFGSYYEEYIKGYKDMNVKMAEDGVSVAIDVSVNRKALRAAMKKMGLFSVSAVPVQIDVSNGKYNLNEDQQLEQNDKINELIALYGLSNVTAADSNGTAVVLSVRHASKKRWTGDLKSSHGTWFASGSSMERVWRELWGKYFGSENIEALMNPKAVLVVNGWFNPEGVREFGRKLKSWDSAVQEVELLDVEMQPTAVSASWSLEVSDQWVLRGYLNDYLPPRGLTFSLEGLEEAK